MFKNFSRFALVVLVILLCAGLMAACGGGEEPAEPEGESSGELSGMLQVNGSTTVAPVGQAWAEAFHEEHPNVDVVVTGTGSGDGIAALINGTTEIAMASRVMKEEEKSKIGDPVEYVVGQDALAVIVHPANPVESLSMAQIKEIFTGKITNWSEVGGDDAEIIVYTRDTSSGTYAFFQEFVLEDEEYLASGRKTASNAAMAQSVAQEETSIGYCGLAYLDDTVKGVTVSVEGGSPVAPSVETAKTGEYPIYRDLYMYTKGEVQGLTKAFLDFGLSEQGQKMVEEAGYLPVD